jgi:hypothetical protein
MWFVQYVRGGGRLVLKVTVRFNVAYVTEGDKTLKKWKIYIRVTLKGRLEKYV